MTKKLLFISSIMLLLLMISSGYVYAQTVSGTIVSADDNEPLTGITVIVKGNPQKGTATNIDGDFSIALSSDEYQDGTLIFSSIGFVTQEIPVNGRSTLNVQMVTDTKLLEEVVVVGFGSQIKETLTGNISSVSAKDLENVPVNSFEQAIQGKASGVFVQSDNGKLGGGITVRVRGTASVTAGAQPLYVIDGVPVNTNNLSSNGAETNPLADINPDDIASIDILKDASSAAIYGSRGSNGVVLITTKRGSAGGTQINFDYSAAVREPSNEKEFLNGEQYYELFDEARANSGLSAPIDAYFNSAFGDSEFGFWDPANNTDWQEEAYQENLSQKFEISASGGDENTRYFLSGVFDDQEGHVIEDKFQRAGARLNLDHNASDKLNLGMNLNFNRSINDRLSNDNSFATPIQLVAQSPLTPVYLDGELNKNTLYNNGLLYKDGASYQTTAYRTLGKAFANYEIMPNLRVQGELGLDLLDQQEKAWYGSNVAQFTGSQNGEAFQTNDKVRTFVSQAYLEYNSVFSEDHSVSATAGASYENTLQEFASVSAEDFPNDNFHQISSAANVTDGTGGQTEYSFVGYFARANYNFRETYLLTLSGRVDGSSRFGEDNRYGFFPAASVGWIMSNESFLSDIDKLSFLKLRASAGQTGNAAIGNFESRALYGAGAYARASALTPTQTPNPNLKWETTTQYDIGIDFGLFSDRITGELDYYIKNTNDLLLNVNIPVTSGFTTQTRNVGELENKGFEFVLNTRNIVGEFNWSTSFNIGANRNEITNIDGQVIEGGFINRAVEGFPIGSFYALEWAGVDPDNGDGLYYVNSEDGIDHSTGTTNNPNAANQVVIGDPNPDFVGGITNTFNYQGFDLSIFFQYVYGNEIYNGGGVYQSCSACYFDNQTADQLDRWQEPGDVTDVPQARLGDYSGSAESSRYLSDGSYLRLKNLTLGYNLPVSVTERLSIRNVRLYFTGVNLLTFTDYDGWDPEVNADFLGGNIGGGTDFYSAPQARIYTFGINVGF